MKTTFVLQKSENDFHNSYVDFPRNNILHHILYVIVIIIIFFFWRYEICVIEVCHMRFGRHAILFLTKEKKMNNYNNAKIDSPSDGIAWQ